MRLVEMTGRIRVYMPASPAPGWNGRHPDLLNQFLPEEIYSRRMR